MAIANKAIAPKFDYPPLRIVRFSGAALTEGVEERDLDGVDEGEIVAQLDGLAALGRTELISDRASDELIATLRGFIQQGPGAV